MQMSPLHVFVIGVHETISMTAETHFLLRRAGLRRPCTDDTVYGVLLYNILISFPSTSGVAPWSSNVHGFRTAFSSLIKSWHDLRWPAPAATARTLRLGVSRTNRCLL